MEANFANVLSDLFKKLYLPLSGARETFLENKNWICITLVVERLYGSPPVKAAEFLTYLRVRG